MLVQHCCMSLPTLLHNVAFVWPTLFNMLQHDPTMLHPFGLGFTFRAAITSRISAADGVEVPLYQPLVGWLVRCSFEGLALHLLFCQSCRRLPASKFSVGRRRACSQAGLAATHATSVKAATTTVRRDSVGQSEQFNP